jgi:hypothetical protein
MLCKVLYHCVFISLCLEIYGVYSNRTGTGSVHIYTGSAKKMYTHFNKRKLCCIIDYCKSTIYFRKHNSICSYFNITYIVILATCFDSFESSSGINIQDLLVHIVLQFLCLSRTIAIGVPLCITKPGLSPEDDS